MSVGNPEVDKIMGPLRKHLKTGIDPKTNGSRYNQVYEAFWRLINRITELNDALKTMNEEWTNRVNRIAELRAELDKHKAALSYCREFWGECDDIHDCTGKSCVICNIESILKTGQALESETNNE